MTFKAFVLFLVVVSAHGAWAQDVALDGNMVQGGLVLGRAAAGSSVTIDGRAVRVSNTGVFLLGFGRDAPGKAVLSIAGPGGKAETRILKIAQRSYKTQRIDGLPHKQVTPDEKALKRIRADNALIAAVRATDTDEAGFASGFSWPAIGPLSGVFGSRRILNGKPRRPHNGVDIAAPRGSPVTAAAEGVVALAEPDMYYTGKSVMIDHGHGLASVYVHMSEILVRVGQRVAKGDVIGRVGASGRVTGPHLHWGLSLFSTLLDPALLTGPMPARAF